MENSSDFILLITGSRDNDEAAELAAAPDRPVIHHKLSYVPVYEKFEELKKFQLKVRNSAGAFGKRICAAIDISEWIGHENEEYFVISMKYFHDRRSRMDFIFTVGECNEESTRPLFFALRCYMKGETVTDDTFLCADRLSEYIMSRGSDSDSAQLLGRMLMLDEMSVMRTYPAVNSMCAEMLSMSGSGVIGLRETSLYLISESSLPSLACRQTAEVFSSEAYALLTEKSEKSA